MGTKRAMALWIESIDRSWATSSIVGGFGLEWESGFANEGNSYEGEALFLGSSEAFRASINISEIHVQRLGFRWRIESAHIPNAPFLVTSDLSIVETFRGSARIEPSEDAAMVFGRDGSGTAYPVSGSDWFGVIEHGESAEECYLRCFSSAGGAVRVGEELVFTEWDCPAGRVLLLCT